MKKNISLTKLFVTVLIFICCNELKAETIAFGYFINKSENRGLDYLQQVLPNSFASSLKNKHKIDTIKPGKLSFLNAESGDYTGREIEERELPGVSPFLGADFFVYGSFEPLTGNRIRLNVKIYRTYSTRVFSFTEEGQLETEIFSLVDRISYQIKNIASDSMFYKSETLAKKSKVSIITNIAGEELNAIYYQFMKNGFRLSSVQGNELYTHLDENSIKSLFTISAPNANYNIITDRSAINLPHGTWSGAEYYKNLVLQRNTYNKYAFNFDKTFDELTRKVRNFQADTFDYIIIIGFDEDKKTAWIRCQSLKTSRLIVAESGIEGSDVEEITEKILKTLTSELPDKF